jgi:uncharacterized SAM-dependent methyltransferase
MLHAGRIPKMTDNKAIDWEFYQAVEYFNNLREFSCVRHCIKYGIDIDKVKQTLINEYDYQPHIVNHFLDNALAVVNAEMQS